MTPDSSWILIAELRDCFVCLSVCCAESHLRDKKNHLFFLLFLSRLSSCYLTARGKLVNQSQRIKSVQTIQQKSTLKPIQHAAFHVCIHFFAKQNCQFEHKQDYKLKPRFICMCISVQVCVLHMLL